MKVNREIVRMQLARWCAAPGEGKAYFRPLVCRGNVENVDIFLVHSHPVTPIPPPVDWPGLDPEKAKALHAEFLRKYPVEDFVRRLFEHAAFAEMHDEVRQALGGKDALTLPQQRLTRFVEANPRPESAVAQAFINAYPAKDLAALKKEDRKIIERGYDLFFEMLQLFRPAWVILLGKPAFDEGAKFFTTRFGMADFRKRWKDVEVREPVLEPLTSLKLHGTKCWIAGARSFDKRAVAGLPESDYTEERFLKFCRGAWATLTTP